MRTEGISPKVVAALLTSLATFLLTKLGLSWNPIVEQAINAAAPILAAYLAPPGPVGVEAIPAGSVPVPKKRVRKV